MIVFGHYFSRTKADTNARSQEVVRKWPLKSFHDWTVEFSGLIALWIYRRFMAMGSCLDDRLTKTC